MTNTPPEWIARSVSRLRAPKPSASPPGDRAGEKSNDKVAKTALDKTVTDAVVKALAQRTTHERLQATLRRGQE